MNVGASLPFLRRSLLLAAALALFLGSGLTDPAARLAAQPAPAVDPLAPKPRPSAPQAAPEPQLPPGEVPYIRTARGPGWYVSFTKLAVAILLFWVWVAAASWISDDTVKYGHDSNKWNGAAVGSGIAGFLALVLIPIFWVGLPIAVLTTVVPLVMYVKFRNPPLPDYEQVFTKPHLRYWLATKLKLVGIKIQAELKTGEDLELLKYKPMGAKTPAENQTNLLTAKQSPAWAASQKVLDEGFQKKAQLLLMDLNQAAGAVVRYQIDGVWEQGESYDLATGMQIAAVYKRVAGLNAEDFRQKLTGTFGVQRGKESSTLTINSQGVQNGARVQVVLDDGGKKLDTLDQLGFSEENIKKIKEVMNAKQGLVLVSALPGGGLSTTYSAVLRAADRYVRTWVGVEDSAAPPEKKVENVEPTMYNSAAGETPATVLPKLIRLYPDCYACRNLTDPASIRILLGKEIAAENHVVCSAVRAREAAEAPLRVLMIQDQAGQRIAPGEFAPHLIGVVSVRLLRRLCTACKQSYDPGEQALQQMRLDPKQVKELFRTPIPTKPNEKIKLCEVCKGRGYQGRAAMAEVLVLNDHLRQVLATAPKLDVFRAEARKAGMKMFQEDGIRLIAAGVTSIEEVQRVMREAQPQQQG